jgi:hypothetical protein
MLCLAALEAGEAAEFRDPVGRLPQRTRSGHTPSALLLAGLIRGPKSSIIKSLEHVSLNLDQLH